MSEPQQDPCRVVEMRPVRPAMRRRVNQTRRRDQKERQAMPGKQPRKETQPGLREAPAEVQRVLPHRKGSAVDGARRATSATSAQQMCQWKRQFKSEAIDQKS